MLFKKVAILMFITSLIWSNAGIAFSQAVQISGVVRDQNTHREISSVNIYVKETKTGTTSDFAGKFSLVISEPSPQLTIVFEHIAYELRETQLDSLESMRFVDLQPRVIPLRGTKVEERRVTDFEIGKDLPQTVAVLKARNYEMQGYIDAGDLLRTDHSIQVDEELSGKKTVSIRGGNPDDVVVLFNGVKMNSTYDNIFDLSLIDLEDIARFEIIKGSNTALYGPEAFSAVINVVPKVRRDYTARFQQRLGTYRSGDWDLHLYKDFNNFLGAYSIKRGGYSRTFVDSGEGEKQLENSSLHHTANFNYSFSEDSNGEPKNSVGAMFIHSSLEFDNQRDDETLDNLNRMFSAKYSGDMGQLKDIDLSVSYRQLEEDQTLSSIGVAGSLDRSIDDQSIYVSAEKRVKIGIADLLFGYQFQRSELGLLDRRRNFQEQPVGLESAELRRQHHGIVSIVKFHGETESELIQNIDVDISFRHDRVSDEQTNAVLRGETTQSKQGTTVGLFEGNDWNETVFKFAINFSGYREDISFDSYLNFGANTKFPTLFQQISSPQLLTTGQNQPNLQPEKNRSVEIGAVVAKDLQSYEHAVSGMQIEGNFFQNQYDNKFRIFTTPGIPVSFYDNVQNARISGFESKASVFLLHKKVTVDFGISRYFISEKAAFPFKSDFKHVLDFMVDHEGYSVQLHWFREGEQVGWLRFPNGEFAEITLPDNNNLDVHVSKTFRVGKLKYFLNVSGRNLLNDDFQLQGLAIRDRRFYLTWGAQY